MRFEQTFVLMHENCKTTRGNHCSLSRLWINIVRDCFCNRIFMWLHVVMHGRCMSHLWLAFLCWCASKLTHRGWVTHICVSKLTIIGSYNGLSPDRRQAIIWTSAGILLIRTHFSKILSKMHSRKLLMHWSYCSLALNHRYVYPTIYPPIVLIWKSVNLNEQAKQLIP